MYLSSNSPSRLNRKRGRKGFTLVEIMVSTTVSAILTVGLFGFFMTSYRIGFVNQERNRINANMRGLTATLLQDGRQSNYFVLYESTSPAARDEANDRRLDGQVGDFLVFVYTEPAPNPLQPSRIKRIVAYYRQKGANDPDGLAPVRRYDQEWTPASSEALEDLLPEESELVLADEVIELSRGLADSLLFFNFWGRSVMVNGQIYHGNAAKRVTETYNFTISPRG
jgi:prepilin-type N-terminal cleavage/methylation domain-containing protein